MEHAAKLKKIVNAQKEVHAIETAYGEFHSHAPVIPEKKIGWVRRLFKSFGPGLITGVSDDDPSGIGTYAASGATFGLTQIWTSLFSLPLMTAVQEASARIGMVTGEGLAGVLRRFYSKKLLYSAVWLLVMANTINIGVDIGAMAAAAELIVPLPFIFLALGFTVITLILEVFVTYKSYAKFLKWLTLSVAAYVITGFLINADWADIAKNLIIPQFHLQKDFVLSLVAIFGTTISPYLFFWQASEEVEEEIAAGRTTLRARRGASAEELKAMRSDVTVGMIVSNVVMFFVILTAAAVIFPQHLPIETAQDAAAALEPFAGRFASYLFAFGIIGTGFLAVPILAGSSSYALSEALGWKTGLYRPFKEAHGFYGIITISTIIGLLINFIGVSPIKALVYAAVVNGFIAVPLIIMMLVIGNNKKIMGRAKNSLISNIFLWLTVLIMAASVIALLYFQFR
ncbi:MAG: putative NRAMP family Mn2+/Fe2+ transporter [Candidatus Magasanikbacteria bacterium]|nr:putative NRAMP family Mn2+/Fe2+ transporter [Candidatus Magasanikbacteria bacterium]